MNKLLVLPLALLAASASAATPLENASALAARLGVTVPAESLPRVETPRAVLASQTPARRSEPRSGSISAYVNVTGSGMLTCSSPRGGWLSGWINLRSDVRVTTQDGASGIVPVTGMVYLSGSCQGSGGFVSGSTMISGSGALYKDGRYAGTASLSGNAFINQYVSNFAWINQSVYVSGRFESAAAR